MADRFFPNEMPDFVPETAEAAEGKAQDSLTKLLRLPYNSFAERIKKSAMELKQTIAKETWVATGRRLRDYSLYTGALGTAFLLFRAFRVNEDRNDLAMCLEIISACDSASRSSGRVTFICGQAGVCALGAVVAMYMGNEQLSHHYLARFKEIKLPKDLPDELLYGRVGYLWACSFINKNIGQGTISSSKMRAVVDDVVRSGHKMAKGGCPLMYEWHGKKYWGAAHGLAGIMNVLMEMELKPNEQEDVKSTLRYMIGNRFPSGNYPSSERSESDRLVHWCHGAPGLALTLTKAAKVFNSEEFQRAAVDAAEVVWERGLLKRVGLCHGISGNTYVFLSLYRLTGDAKYLYQAKAFACFLHDRAQALMSEGIMHGGDCPYSLFEGVGGMAYLFLDMSEPLGARFPGYEL